MDHHPRKKMANLAEPLTRREMEILVLLSANHSNAEIAESLNLALSSVKWYAQQIYGKLGVATRKQAVAKGRALGILEQPGRPNGNVPGLPTGTVTFLLTDIEGSTPMWEQIPEAMQVSVAQHHTILRQAIEANSGQVFQVIGDAFQAAFPLASEGLCAALAAQRALQEAQWGLTGPLKVRMGLHTGPAELDPNQDAPYKVSHTLNRAARIMSAGHGGQVLLSQVAADLVERALPQGVTLLDLGQHHLKGMQRLEHLYQLAAPDLPHHFPPLSTGVKHPHNLPVQLTSFIGREKEIEALVELLLTHSVRLLTLTGSGGTGKTRLALKAAEKLLEAFPQGVWLVELAPVSDPELVPRAVANTLGVREESRRDITQVLASALHDQQMLLVLDNCEHVVSAASALAGQLLLACPQLHILATSREILGVAGEVPFRCPSLSLPKEKPTAGGLAQYEALKLFEERAKTISPGFILNETNVQVIARICQRLDGIPLAIELSAARIRLLSLEQIAQRLDQAFRLLTGGARSVLPRHQTLKALIDWSYNLLSIKERILLLRLSVFAGGWTLEAAEQTCSDPEKLPSEQILDLLGQLLDKSMIQIDRDQTGEPRYRMLETVRQYAHERLVENDGVEDLRERHLNYFLDLALRAEPNLRAREAPRWLDALDREVDNIRLALEWSLSGSVVKGLHLTTALHWLWSLRDHRSEGVDWLEKLLSAEDAAHSVGPYRSQDDWIARGRALYIWNFLAVHRVLGDRTLTRKRGLESVAIFSNLCDELHSKPDDQQFYRLRCDLAIAKFSMSSTRQDYMECLQLFKTLHDSFFTAEAYLYLVVGFLREYNLDASEVYNAEHLRLRQELGDLDGEGFAWSLSANLAFMKGQKDQAIEMAKRSLSCFEAIRNRITITMPHSILFNAMMVQGNYQLVIDQIDQNEMERAFAQGLRNEIPMVQSLSYAGFAAWALKEYERAVLYAEKALERTIDLPFTWKKLGLYVLGRVGLSRGDYPRARQYLLQALTPALTLEYYTDSRVIQALGVLATALHQYRRAAALFGAQDALADWLRNILCPVEREEYELALAATRAGLREEAFGAAWEEGKTMTVVQIRQYAEETPPAPPVPKSRPNKA